MDLVGLIYLVVRPGEGMISILRRSTAQLALNIGLFICIGAGLAQAFAEDGIPVTDPLVKSKCAGCHATDDRGNMQQISWERTTPEGWQEVLKRMILANGVKLTPAEARSMVMYLSTEHGLAPEEARGVMYDTERRIHDETKMGNENLRGACAKCH